jgi:hypothetical protein
VWTPCGRRRMRPRPSRRVSLTQIPRPGDLFRGQDGAADTQGLASAVVMAVSLYASGSGMRFGGRFIFT